MNYWFTFYVDKARNGQVLGVRSAIVKILGEALSDDDDDDTEIVKTNHCVPFKL